MSDKLQAMYAAFGETCLRELTNGGGLCESPIEEMLLMALLFSPDEAIFGSHDQPVGTVEQLRAWGHEPCVSLGIFDGWLLFAQEVVGPYRLDFAIVHLGAGRIAIECDGHEFHERTKEQAARDKRRDRALQSAGWRVVRFAGSEIYRDAHACVAEIRGLMSAMSEESKAAWRAARESK